MRSRGAALGAALATTTAIAWGGQFVVGKSALERVDSFPLTTIRYAIAVVLWLAVLAVVEGRRSLLLDGHGLRLFWLGTLGFAGFNLLAYTGLAHARPESASLIVALAPLLTALVLWRRTGTRPSGTTFALLGIALAGVALVISRGHPTAIVDGALGWEEALVLGGVFSFVIYGLGAAQFPAYSALRYTTLTAALGWVSIAVATAVALAAGLVPAPRLERPLGGDAADRLPRPAGRGDRRPRVERGDQADRPPEHVPLRQPHPRDHVRDRDRPRVPAKRRRARRRCAHDRRPGREQPARPPQ